MPKTTTYSSLPTSKVEPLNEHQLQCLQAQGFPRSLAESLSEVKKAFALRLWIVDNSSSMATHDGHRIREDSQPDKLMTVDCSRWDEIRSCVEYHMQLACLIQAPTRFTLLNKPQGSSTDMQTFSVAEGDDCDEWEADAAIQQLRLIQQPRGPTPLTRHILKIRNQVESMIPALHATGQRVAIIICTDGLPTDEKGRGGTYEQNKFVHALRGLEGLPVWIVIRLCTDDDKVVSYYNEIDSLLELSIDVLDDFNAEAEEISEFNPWINYALPLHRLREMGYHERLFDIMDERPFTKSQVHEYCTLLFGRSAMDGAPDPVVDWNQFLAHVTRLQDEASMLRLWNPLRRKAKPLVSTKRLQRCHRNRRMLFLK